MPDSGCWVLDCRCRQSRQDEKRRSEAYPARTSDEAAIARRRLVGDFDDFRITINLLYDFYDLNDFNDFNGLFVLSLFHHSAV